MSRKHSHRKIRPRSVPMLINRGLQNADIETQEIMLVESFAGGWATPYHYDCLVDMRNVLTLANAHKDIQDNSVITICDAMRIPLANIRARHEKTGRMGVSGQELQLLRAFAEFYADFWMRQPVSLYERACDELNDFKSSLLENAA